MEETTVSTSEAATAAAASVESANVFAFAPEPVDVAQDEQAVQSGSEETGEVATATAADEADEGGGDPDLDDKPQKEVGKAFAKEQRRLKEKYQREYEAKLNNDPLRVVGRQIVEDIMQRDGIGMDAAAKEAQERWIEAKARQNNITPEFARRVYGATATPERNGDFDADAKAQEVMNEIQSMQLPDGFDMNTAIADEGFAQLLIDMPTNAAVRVYAAEQRAKAAQTRAEQAPQDVAEKLRARQQIPQSTRPQRNVTPEVNYRDMPTDDFFALKEKLEKKRR